MTPLSPQLRKRTRFRYMQGRLDQLGIMTTVHRVSINHFELLVNGEVKRSYKTRQSCNKLIEKLFKEKHVILNKKQ